MRDLLNAHLKRIDRDPTTHAVLRLFPFVRPIRDVEDARSQPRVVTIDPRIAFGRPVVAGTRIPTEEVANRFSAGETLEEIAEDLNVEPEAIQHALRFELRPQAA
jgi:uncharacterized protein (DUF433 family)